jgi:hypothetical protein
MMKKWRKKIGKMSVRKLALVAEEDLLLLVEFIPSVVRGEALPAVLLSSVVVLVVVEGEHPRPVEFLPSVVVIKLRELLF